MPLDPGSPVPEVTATTQAGERETVGFEAPTVLCFFGLTDEGLPPAVASLDTHLGDFHEMGAAVYGVSTADADRHATVASETGADLPLLADPDRNVVEAFDVAVTDGAAALTTFVCAGWQVCGLYEGGAGTNHGPTVLQDLLDTGLVVPPKN